MKATKLHFTCPCGGTYEKRQGWESVWALVCGTCGDYHYFIGHLYCCDRMDYGSDADLRALRLYLKSGDSPMTQIEVLGSAARADRLLQGGAHLALKED